MELSRLRQMLIADVNRLPIMTNPHKTVLYSNIRKVGLGTIKLHKLNAKIFVS